MSHQKPKRRKKSSNKVEPASYINLVTAILQLVTTIILLIEAATAGRGGGTLPCLNSAYHKCRSMSTV